MGLSFSIVINTLDRAASLIVTLQALQYLRHPRFEVIVVNGPSQDDTAEVVRAFPAAKTLDCPEANLSMSRNIGARAAAGDVVCYLDDDAVPEPSWLDELEKAYADPAVGAVGGYVRDHTGVSFQARAIVCDRMARAHNFDTLAEMLADPDVACTPGAFRFPAPTGCNSSYRREALLRVGGFDEDFVYFLDETDVCLRIIDDGWTITYAEAAEVHHKYAASAQRDASRIPRRLYHPARSRALFACRFAGKTRPKTEIFGEVAEFGAVLLAEARRFVAEGKISHGHYAMLQRDVELGLRDGVMRATSGVPPKLMTPGEPAPFKLFSPIRPASGRMRIVLFSREDPLVAHGEVATWTQMLAGTLAQGGHEITIVSEAADQHATVDFQNGVWAHRVASLATAISPDAGWAAAAAAEVDRIRSLRGVDVISWPVGDPAGSAATRVGRTPTVMSVHPSPVKDLPARGPGLRDIARPTTPEGALVMRQLASAPYIVAASRSVLRDIERIFSFPMDRSGVAVWPPESAGRASAGRAANGSREKAMLDTAVDFYRYVVERTDPI